MGGGRLSKDAQEVILQGYIQGSSINGCLKMAGGLWGCRRGGRWGGGCGLRRGVGCVSGTEGGKQGD